MSNHLKAAAISSARLYTKLGSRTMSPGVGSSFFVDRLTRPFSLSNVRIITCNQYALSVAAASSHDCHLMLPSLQPKTSPTVKAENEQKPEWAPCLGQVSA